MMEPVNSSSLGAMGSLLRKLDELLRTEERAQGLIGDLRIISSKMEKLSEVHSPPHTVKYWMNDARELSYDMEVFVDLFVHASQPEDLPAKVAWILTWTKEILGFEARVKEVNERCERYNLVNEYCKNHRNPAKIEVSHHLRTLYKEPNPVAMEEPTNKLLEWLMPRGHGEEDLKLKVVSVLGDEGVGKSTLVNRLWQESSQDKFDFKCRAFVQTAKKPDTRMILRSILSQVHPKQPLNACKVPKLIDDLRKHLQDKRYFIVIDGLWDVSVWHIIKRAFPTGNQRIITTTSVENVAHVSSSYDSNSIVNVKCLCGDEAKKLFVDRAFGSEKGCPPQFNDVTDEITRKCGGFPLAIICTARIVANQLETEQEQQLDYVNKFLPSNLRTQSSSMEILNQVLKLCYSSLPHCLKTCLLYLSVYPENYLFLKEDLVKQWIAEDFICTPEGKDIVDVAGSYFDELLSLGLIQQMDIVNSNKKGLLSYTVHPVVFDFITSKSMEDNFVTIIDYSQLAVVLSEKVRRLSLHFGSATYATTPESVELSQVRSLSFIGLLGCMPSIAEFKLVRVMVLHICSDDEDSRFSLSEICHLLQLRYLQVRCNVTVNLPYEIQYLKYLETLEINAVVENVPSDIVHLSRLLHIHLGRKTGLNPAFSSVDWNSYTCSNISIESFEFLPPIWMSGLPRWFRQLRKLHRMEIVVRQLSNNIVALAELPFLKHLSLYVRTAPTTAIILSSGMFPALEYFKFACGVLSLGFQKGTLPNLRRLKLVFNAHKREQYDILVGISHLLSLQKVVASIGLAPGAEESNRIAAESAFKDAIREHPCHRSFEEVVKLKRVDPVDEDWNQQEESSNERGQVPLWKLAFQTPPQLPIFTGSKIEDEAGNPLEVILVDADTGSPAALQLGLRIELVPVFGDFPPDGREDWSAHEFQRNVVREREGKRPLLTGDVRLTMRDGRATVGELQFTDNSSWVHSRKFRIGACVVPASYDGGRIVEAITEAFMVRDQRGELYRKHYPPVLGDSVWRLEKIGKEGVFHRKLKRNNIETVQEFLRMLTVKPDDLRAILGDGMTDRMWEATTSHARTCVPGDEVYVKREQTAGEEIQNMFSHHQDHMPLSSLPLSIQEADVLPPLKLVFAKQLKLPIFTNNKLVDIENNPIEIQLMDTRTNSMIAPPDTHLGSSSVRLEVLVLDGDFQCEDRDVWTTDQFNAAIVKARKGKRPLLVGSLSVPMNNHGVAVIDDVSFTDNSSWIRCRKFRIGVRIMPGDHLGSRVKEAVSGSFTVKDHRGELYKKHYPPLLTDNIWRLKNIGKDGPIDKRLESEGIRNVQDFLKFNTMDPEKLKALVGMSDRPWNETLIHAKTCDMGRKCYVFKTVGCDITFNPIGEVLAARIGDQTFALQELHPHQLFHVKQLATQAYQMWDQLEEVANESFVPTSNSGREPSESQESMISSGSQNAKYLDCTGTATSSAAAMSTNSSSTSDSTAAVPANDAMFWSPSIAPEYDFSWQDSAGCWDQVD